MSKIVGEMAGCYSPFGKTIILKDKEGNELVTGVVTEQEKRFDAKVTDVRINKKFVNDEGALTGENTITYRTYQSSRLVLPAENYTIQLNHFDQYDYTKLQCIIAKFNTSLEDSTAADKVVIGDNVYAVNSTDVLSVATKNADTKSIDLNIVNDTEDMYLIHFFTYKEEM